MYEFTNRVTNIPTTMPSWNSVPSRPRRAAGAHALMYTGQTMEQMPMATPAKIRATRKPPNDPGSADPMPESRNSNAHRYSVRFRPRRSLRKPPISAPGMQPTIALAAAKPS